jgi:hypothetical protein
MSAAYAALHGKVFKLARYIWLTLTDGPVFNMKD